VINQVQGVVSVSWVAPRVLTKPQVCCGAFIALSQPWLSWRVESVRQAKALQLTSKRVDIVRLAAWNLPA